jgi:hypothetical protein
MSGYDACLVFFTVSAVLLSLLSYLPKTIKRMISNDIETPTLNTVFLSVVILVITSKLCTVYGTLDWTMREKSQTCDTQGGATLFIWCFFISMLFGILVYSNFAIGNSDRERTLSLLQRNKLLSGVLCFGILGFYVVSALGANHHRKNTDIPTKVLLERVVIISTVDFVLFVLLWIRFWFELSRQRVK